jgi:PST family polysaccharide transporter
MGDYLTLGVFLPMGVVGKYFFGYQFTAQVLELLATNLQHVLFPALSRVADQPERQTRAILRSIRMLVFVAAPVSVCLAVVVGPLVTILDEMVWNHKWSSTIGLMQIFAVTAPMRMFTDLLTAALSSQGRFRVSAIVYFCEGVWLMAAAAIAVAIYGDDLTGLALTVAVAQVIFSVGASIHMLGKFGIDWRGCVRSMFPAWIVALGAGACSLALLTLLPSESPEFIDLVVGAAAFGTSFIAIARVFLVADLVELAGLAPTKAGRIIRAALLLPPPALAYDGKGK